MRWARPSLNKSNGSGKLCCGCKSTQRERFICGVIHRSPRFHGRHIYVCLCMYMCVSFCRVCLFHGACNRRSQLDQPTALPLCPPGLSAKALIDQCASAFATQFNVRRQQILCRNPSVYIHDLCASFRLPFIDVYFPPDFTSLRAQHTSPDEDGSALNDALFSWQRASDHYPPAHTVLFHPDRSKLGHMSQGRLGDCWCVRRCLVDLG